MYVYKNRRERNKTPIKRVHNIVFRCSLPTYKPLQFHTIYVESGVSVYLRALSFFREALGTNSKCVHLGTGKDLCTCILVKLSGT